MKKIVRLTESELVGLVNKVIKEEKKDSEYEFKTKKDDWGVKLTMFKNKEQIAQLYLLNLKDAKKNDEDLISLLKIEKKINFNSSNSVFIHSIEVSPLYRGKGISTKLMSEGFNLVKKMKYDYVLSIVDSDNTISLNLHNKLGYKIGKKYNNCHLVWKKI